MILSNKKGAALMQVLLVTVVLAGMATMLLRAMLSRSTSSRRTVRTVSAQTLMNSCMSEVNMFWSLKKPSVFQQDLQEGIMYCAKTSNRSTSCADANKRYTYKCKELQMGGGNFQVLAYFPTTSCSTDEADCATYAKVDSTPTGDSTRRQIVYEVIEGNSFL